MCLDAANDAHACLALYHALRIVHTRSVAEGIIPVGNPPPWEDKSTVPRTPAPPPFRAKTTAGDNLNPQIMPTSELQSLTPVQLESLIPWSDLILDCRAEMDDKRTAVRAARIQQGVDVNGKGEAVVAAEADAAAAGAVSTSSKAARPKVASKPKVDTISKSAIAKPDTATPTKATANSKVPDTIDQIPVTDIQARAQTPGNEAIADTSVDPVVDDTWRQPSRGRIRVLERRRAVEEKRNEVMGKRWPPVRAATSTPDSSFSTTPLSQPGGPSPLISRPVLSNDAPYLPSAPKRPAAPIRYATSPASTSRQAPSSEQLRAYLLWHNRLFTVAQICTTMGSAKRPLTKNTVM